MPLGAPKFRFRRCLSGDVRQLRWPFHLSLGRQKATSGTFSTDGFGWLGLNPAGVSLFRMHVERCPLGPQNFDFDAACQVMSGSCVGLSSSFFRASESNVRHFFGVHVERCPIQARRKLLVHGRPLPGFPWFFEQFRRCLSGDVILTISTPCVVDAFKQVTH